MDFVGSSNFFYWRRFLQFPWDWELPSNSQYSFLIEAFGLHTKNNFRIKKCHGKWTKKCMQWNKKNLKYRQNSTYLEELRRKMWSRQMRRNVIKKGNEKYDQDRWGEIQWNHRCPPRHEHSRNPHIELGNTLHREHWDHHHHHQRRYLSASVGPALV